MHTVRGRFRDRTLEGSRTWHEQARAGRQPRRTRGEVVRQHAVHVGGAARHARPTRARASRIGSLPGSPSR